MGNAERRTHSGGWVEGGAAQTARDWIASRLAEGLAVSATLVALSRIDLVNAAYGRDAGSALIDAAGARIGATAHLLFGPLGHVARVGGACFLIAGAGANARPGLAAAALGDVLARPFALGEMLGVLGSRIGTVTSGPNDTARTLLYRADDALRTARSQEVAGSHIAPTDAIPVETLAVDLHHAIDRRQIGLQFQPQVDIATGRITGAEALARWDHPLLGELGADPLFAAATRADLGVALSSHIQRVALDLAAAWPAALGALRLSLNVTAGDLARPGFASGFLDLVAASGFAASRLTVEITETGQIADLSAAAAALARLRSGGCRIAVDDFGAGYSSLVYLKALPIDYVKLDRTLVVDLASSASARVIVRGVIAIAHELGLSVIAEGVETAAVRDILAEERCDQYQGFLCAGPLDTAALARLMEG